MEKRYGRQEPTVSVILPYKKTFGQEAIDLYEKSGRTAYPWQVQLEYDLMAVNEDGLWSHAKFGYAIPRRNGKSEDILGRMLWGYKHGERILYTAHQTSTSHSMWERFCQVLKAAGYEEIARIKKNETYTDEDYKSTKQFGLERVEHANGARGLANFRTRTSSGGLGEGYDLLIIDEAQEYTTDQETALKYVVTDSDNPQTIFLGTPPTAVSSGTVFVDYRDTVLQGKAQDAGWAEWSVDKTHDPNDVDAWYETNPSLGYKLTERNIRSEISGDEVDFNIQRLGLWLRYNQKSAISRDEWLQMKVDNVRKILRGEMCVGIRFGHDGVNVALSIAVKTKNEKIFVETVDCRPIREGTDWILAFLKRAQVRHIAADGAPAKLLADAMKKERLKPLTILKTAEVIAACNIWEQAITAQTIAHAGQPSLTQSVSNCEKRTIGSNGGFGYRSIRDDVDVALMDSAIIAHWMCTNAKEKKKQRVSC